MNEYFNKIFCINLDRREDKWKLSQYEFKKNDLVVERVSAIDGDTLRYNGIISPAVMGCAMSHLSVLKKQVENLWSRILILEDDVEFIPNVNQYFNENIINIPNWDMLYLGATFKTKLTQVNDSIAKIESAYTTSSYAITLEAAKILIPELEKLNAEVDVIYSKHQTKLNTYVFKPAIAWQRPGFSDIQKRTMNYKHYFDE